MLESEAPTKFSWVWAYDATNPTYVRAVPQTPTSQNAAASFQLGFPPNTFLPDTSGGAGPWGQDANGILQQLTAGVQWLQAGGVEPFDATFAANTAGYPKYAMVRSVTFPGAWISTIDNNSNNPDTGGADWTPVVLLNPSLRAGASVFTVYTYSGNNPNGFVAGTASSGSVCPDMCWTQGGDQGLWVCVSSGPASGAGQAVWVQIWNGAGAGPSLPLVANGQCRLVYTNGTTVTLLPFGGGGLIINDVLQVIPSPAPTIAASTCSAGPNYIYSAISGGGSMTLEASTTGYTMNSSGLANKIGDATRSLVGWAYVAGGVFVQSLVASWYNRRAIPIQGDPNFSAVADDPVLVDLGPGAHLSVFVWGDEGLQASAQVLFVTLGEGASSYSTGIGLDGALVNQNSGLNGSGYNLYCALPGALGEGLHTLSCWGSSDPSAGETVIAMMLTATTRG